MPTTRAARRAARCLTEVLPSDALSLVLYQLPLAHDIASVAPTCHMLCNAAKLTQKLRPFSGEVVTLRGHTDGVLCVAVAGDHVVTGSADHDVKVWHDDACVRTIHEYGPQHATWVMAVAVLTGGTQFVSVSNGGAVRLWRLDGTCVRTFVEKNSRSSNVFTVTAMPDGVHFVFGLVTDIYVDATGELRLYHVDGTLVHTFKGGIRNPIFSVQATRGGQHILNNSNDGAGGGVAIASVPVATPSILRGGGGRRRGAPQGRQRSRRP